MNVHRKLPQGWDQPFLGPGTLILQPSHCVPSCGILSHSRTWFLYWCKDLFCSHLQASTCQLQAQGPPATSSQPHTLRDPDQSHLSPCAVDVPSSSMFPTTPCPYLVDTRAWLLSSCHCHANWTMTQAQGCLKYPDGALWGPVIF